jgi:glucose/arabinose dehydrogenase
MACSLRVLGVSLMCLSAVGCRSSSTTPSSSPPTPVTLGHHEITAESLPAPFHTGDANNGPTVVARPSGAKLILPAGFTADIFAEGGFTRPRWIVVADDGAVLLADSEAGTITELRDADGDGRAESRRVIAKGLDKPFGMAIHPAGHLYVGTTGKVVRFEWKPGNAEVSGAPQTITTLPDLGYREHWTRNVVVAPDGQHLFVTVGSASNVDPEPEPRATILHMKLDGSERRVFASGTRNPIGLAFEPRTRALWAAVQERDRMGDDLVPDYVTAVKDGGFYGWPFAYIGPREDPRRRGEQPELVKKTLVPDVLIQAHSAVLGLTFYEGTMFPTEYHGDAFVALHGSWNRSQRTGYSVARIRMREGKAAGGYDDFLTGWMTAPDSREVWGRPVGLAVAKDGALLVVDDGAKVVWRVAYRTP